MCGWFKAAIARASRSKRSENCSFETFIATSRPRRLSSALYTSPMPPAPIGVRISYGPSLSPTDSGMSMNKSIAVGQKMRRASIPAYREVRRCPKSQSAGLADDNDPHQGA